MSKLDISDIVKMIKDKESLPMYDVINNTIIMIPHNKIYYNFTKNYLRLIDNNILKKLGLKISIDETEISSRFYKIIFDNHPSLGKQLTLCEKPYFLYFLNYYNNPYYTENELKLKNDFFNINGKNNELICKKLKKIELSKNDILNNFKYITNNGYDRIIKYYSFIGAQYINDYLRGTSNKMDNINKDIILKLDTIIKESPKLKTDQILFRFISDDTFLKTETNNGIFIDKGFVSTTRNPIMKLAKANFGNIMMRIYVPKKHSDKYISLESISLFPDEQEILLPRGSKLKLLKEHTINDIKIYDYEFIGIEKKAEINLSYEIKEIDIKYYRVDISLEDLYNELSYYSIINFKSDVDNKFYYGYTKKPKALNKFFHFEKDIFYLYQLDKSGNIDIFIEIIDGEIFINYFMKFFGHNKKETIVEYLKRYKVISELSVVFNIKKISINSIQIPGYMLNKTNLSNNSICLDYYIMLKSNKITIPKFLKLGFPIYYLKYMKNKKIEDTYISEFPSLKIFSLNNKINILDELFISIIDKEPSLMIEFYNLCSNYYQHFNNPFNNDFYFIDIQNMIFK
jgi:hypothetical protein